MLKGRRLELMTWPQARTRLAETKLAIVPVGSIEQHGPHLPLGTDFMVADRLARMVGPLVDAIVTPTVPVGFAVYHDDFAGTLSVPRDVLAAYIGSICECLVGYGCTHIIFINGHGGNFSSLETVGLALRKRGIAVAVVQWWDTTGALNPKWSALGHGDFVETSMMLAIAPDAVQMREVKVPVNKQLTPKISILDGLNCQFGEGFVKVMLSTKDTTDTGDMFEYGHSPGADYSLSPAQATAAEGEAILTKMAEFIAAFAEEFRTVSLS